jgi:hypothetical protein
VHRRLLDSADVKEDLMDVEIVRERAEAFCAALDAGDIEAATAHMSPELHRNLGEVLALLPLPSTGSTVQSVEKSGPGWNVVLHLNGESDEVELQTRWKDRDSIPTIVEVSHLGRTERGIPEDEGEAGAEAGAGEDGERAAVEA